MAREHAHHAAPATFYLDPATLAAQVQESKQLLQQAKQVTAELALSVAQIAGGVWDRYRFIESREDFQQEVVVWFLRYGMKRIDPNRSVFNFVTTLAFNRGLTLRSQHARRQANHQQYRNLSREIHERLDRRRGVHAGRRADDKADEVGELE